MDYKEKLKAIINSDDTPFVDIDTFLKYFPELKENEDEKIRKAIIEFFESEDDNTTYSLVPKKDILAWLEKQGEQKETLCDKCKKAQPSPSCQDITELGRCAVEHEQKSNDKVEPKFKKGEWITIKE